MILIPDGSDDDNLEDTNKNPLWTEARTANIKKRWACEMVVEESQGKRHAWPEPPIKESVHCVTKGHAGDQCQGGRPNCNFKLVIEADGLHENVVKQKGQFETMHGMDVTEGPKSDAASSLEIGPSLGVQQKEAPKKHQEPKELQEASVAEAEASESQLHTFCDETQPDFFSDEETQPGPCDETQPDFFGETPVSPQ